MCNKEQYFSDKHDVIVADGRVIKVEDSGNLSILWNHRNVYIPELGSNLLSVGMFMDEVYDGNFSKGILETKVLLAKLCRLTR